MSDEESGPTVEEMEFLRREFDLLIKKYRLEGLGNSLAASVYLLNEMFSMGLIEKSREGIMKGMDIIVKRFPEVDESFKKFASAYLAESQNEMKQMERPN